MGDEYDSGDDLFADVNEQDLARPAKKVKVNYDDEIDDEALASLPDTPSKKTKLADETSPQDANHLQLAKGILKDTFGYPDFRHEQEGAIAALLRGQNSLVVFPTGAGKSLCFQIPAIAIKQLDTDRAQAGISIVVSPLIALMKDQTDALKRKGVAAEAMDSSRSYAEQLQIKDSIRKDRLRLLYVSPEKLNNETFVQSMREVPGGIRLLAVDEAHCISEWGHSFRPDYLKVARFVDEIKAERVICLTATATPKVIDDISKAFSIQPNCVFRTPPYRPNLHLAATAKTTPEKLSHLVQFLTKHPGPTVVYATLREQAESLASQLVRNGFKAKFYHAGMPADVRKQVQDAFMRDEVSIIVATTAFGMGIDKASIRAIVHYDLPSSVEEYSQQIGRAGRDGLPSHCIFYLCNDDFYVKESFARGDLPSRKCVSSLIRDVLKRKPSSPDDSVIKVSNYSLSGDHDIKVTSLASIFASLELRFGLLRAVTPEYSSYEFEDQGRYFVMAKADPSPAAKAIVELAKKKKKWYNFDVNAAMNSTQIIRTDFITKLQTWHDRGIIVLKTSGVEHRYRILRDLPSTDAEIEDLVDKLYKDLEATEKDTLARVRQVMQLVTGEKCFALSLAEHFGMRLPGGKSSCGHCTFCETKRPVVLPPRSARPVDFGAVETILEECSVRDDARLLARVAFGVKSPRITKLKLDRLKCFGSMVDHDFEALLKEFSAACGKAT